MADRVLRGRLCILLYGADLSDTGVEFSDARSRTRGARTGVAARDMDSDAAVLFEYSVLCDYDAVILSVDEYEVFRLLDYEQITQRECAFQMKVARTTVTDIYNQARQKLADALVNGKRLIIDGGSYDLCERRNNCVGFRECFEAKYQYGTEDRKED